MLPGAGCFMESWVGTGEAVLLGALAECTGRRYHPITPGVRSLVSSVAVLMVQYCDRAGGIRAESSENLGPPSA